MSWWLVGPSGLRRRLDGRGLILGRGPSSDWVARNNQVSAVHALVTLGSSGPQLRSLGRNPTRVDGKEASRARLRHGSIIELPGLSLSVEDDGEAGAISWMLVVRGQTFALRPDLVLGSGPGCPLRLDGWPTEALRFRVAQHQPVAEALAPLYLNGEPFEPGAVESLVGGDRLGTAREELEVVARGERVSTLIASPFPLAARFRFLPTGGVLQLSFAGDRHFEVDMPELRARLIATLLSPPHGYELGDFVPDEVLLPKIWPGQSERGRLDLNTLVHRARKDLLRAGVDPGSLLERARRGGGVALRLARGASVQVG